MRINKLVLGAGLLLICLFYVRQAPAKTGAQLQRVDFVVTGTSCAACIYRLEHKLLDAPGVKKAALMYIKPYAAAVVFDPGKTSWSKLTSTALKGETAKFKLEKQRRISKVPQVLIPENTQLSNKTKSALKDFGMFSQK